MSAAALSSSSLRYVHCDVPEGMTLHAWRASRDAAASSTRMSGVLRRVRRVRRARRRANPDQGLRGADQGQTLMS